MGAWHHNPIVIFQATGSRAVTTFLMCWATVAIATAVCSGWIAAGRLVYAFARDGGVPFSTYFVQIDDKRAFPLRATIATVIFVSVYGLIFLASTTAFNSIITSAVLFLTITFAVPQAFVAARGRAKCLPTRPLRLGKFGYLVNVISAAITIPIIVLVCFPPVNPTTTENMNYASVLLRGFKGPKLNVADIPALN
ncbi:amino acid/polyamine transporter I [Bisporella sp. PMI_857]|nr:amino acid/polyamine transporter I [Bisporella sp. PMI_857]